MKSTKYYCNTLLLILLFSSCTPIPDRRVLLKDDLRPPVFVGVDVHHQRQISLHFSEPVFFEKNDFHATPSLEVESFSTEAEELKINLAADMSPGQEYALSLTVSDAARNSHSLLCRFFGYNPRVPELLLNEITTQGSTSNPDKVELKVLSPGNTAGVVVYEGTRDFFDHYKVLPPVEVETGDYLVIHFRPSGTEDEVDERESKIECRAEDASDYGWDFWVEGGGGLSGNNGVISVYRHTAGELIDGFLYSNRSSSSDKNYRGFGSSATVEKADQLWLDGGWVASGELIAPEDAVNPDDSTATRSMCRHPEAGSSQQPDTDSAEDWYIVDTSESSFGYVNSLKLYEP